MIVSDDVRLDHCVMCGAPLCSLCRETHTEVSVPINHLIAQVGTSHVSLLDDDAMVDS